MAQWNASANADKRARLVAAGYSVGGVSAWRSEAGGEGTLEDVASRGCAYLFHDDATFVSFTGHWEGEALVWDEDEFQGGSWSPEQEGSGYASSFLVAADGTVSQDPDWQPPTPEQQAGPLATAPRGGREGTAAIEQSGPTHEPYAPLEVLEITGTDDMPRGCSAPDMAGLFDHFFEAFNRGDSEALATFFGPDFQYYVHPRNFVDQPRTRAALGPFFLERHAAGEQMRLLAVRVDATADDATTVEIDLALAFLTPTTAAAHWIGALVNCRAQTIVNVGYRSYGLDLITGEIVAHASCSTDAQRPPPGHHVACARVRDIDERLAL